MTALNAERAMPRAQGKVSRVVIDARMAMDGGIGTYLQQLLPRIAGLHPEWQITALGDLARMRSLGWNEIGNLGMVQCAAPIFSVREQVELPFHTMGGVSLYWAPNYDVPVLTRAPMVVTIHDVNHLALPELLGGTVRRAYARWMLATAVHRSRRVLYDSQFTREEALRLLGDGSSKGTVVHLGVSEEWIRAKELATRPVAQPYLLYVGNIKRHKNVPFLVRAFARVMSRIPHRLLLVGRTEGLRADPQVKNALASAGDRVALLGELAAPEVRRHVAHADAVVTASLYEGFGLPALEAMAAGTPCLVSTAGSLPEICGDAALYADPHDEAAFADAVLRIATDEPLRASLVARGRARAAEFSWDRAARETAAVLSEAL